MRPIHFLLSAVLLLSLSSAHGEVLREVGFEDGWEGLETEASNKNHRPEITSQVSRKGGKSVKIDRPRGTNRMEVKDPTYAPLRKPVRYEWSLRVDKNDNEDRIIVSQLHHHQGDNRPNQWLTTGSFLIRHDRPKRMLTVRHGYQVGHKKEKFTHADLVKAEYGKWYDFVVEARWSWEQDGYLRIWVDGKKAYEKIGSVYMDYGPKTTGPRWKAGAYGRTGAALVYVDEYRMTVGEAGPPPKPDPEPKPEPEPEPDDLAPLIATMAWAKRYSNLDVRVYFQTPDDQPLHMEHRTYTHGSVTFTTLDGKELEVFNQRREKDGWMFFLRGPLPDTESVVMSAKDGWVTGAPAIERQTIPNWTPNEPEK